MSTLWTLLRRPRPTPPREEATADTPEFRSRALRVLLDERPAHRPWHVLDLGPASNRNLRAFAGWGARYTVEDLYDSMRRCRRGSEVDAACLADLAGALEYGPEDRFDLILAWDLPNFLGPEALRVLTRRLLPHTRRGTLMYSLIAMQAGLPAKPARCEVADEETVRMHGWNAPRVLPSPRYGQVDLGRAMAPFREHKAYLLKLQVQEVVMVRGEGVEG